MSVFKLREEKEGRKLFFDETGAVDIQRYEKPKHKRLDKLLDLQQSYFWRPTEFNLSKDVNDYKSLSDAQKHIFDSNLQRQILLDSVQGRAPTVCYQPLVSDETLEALITWWQASEVIHSQSYTHIQRVVKTDPSKVFDDMRFNEHIIKCGNSVSVFDDVLLEYNAKLVLGDIKWGDIEHKRALWNSLLAKNALEQIRFHVSFVCTFSFGQQQLMTGSSKIVSSIKLDESLHVGITEYLLKTLPKEDADFAKIEQEQKHVATEIYLHTLEEENEWIDYLFSKGQIFGLTEKELKEYLKWLVGNKMKQMKLDVPFDYLKKRPLDWLEKWESTNADSVAPQEAELINYQVAQIDTTFDKSKVNFVF